MQRVKEGIHKRLKTRRMEEHGKCYTQVTGIKKADRTNYRLLIGAGNEARTRDPNLGKVVLYH